MARCRRVALLAGLVAGAFFTARPSLAQKAPEQTLAGLSAADGLEVSLWANEPGVVKPTDMDIDERGRIWITEAANYRGAKRRPEGDRIMILEDTKHTGVCDSYKVFVQDTKLFAPLGICKLGNKLYVAQSPNVFVYTIDESGDHPVGEPKILFAGFGGTNHDHGVHSGLFGPDGRFYFNSGNEGGRGYVMDADGKPVVDRTGSEVGMGSKLFRGKPKQRGESVYREGLALSSNLDGTDFEVLGYDFRNNYELTVDSFGTVWQSDNDDDGNQGVRINYVMEGGDFGYTGPTGSNWSRDMAMFPGQTRQEAHWHQHFPGIVPNMVHTGAGAPTGIVCYEGELLPAPYRNALLHCDAGRNIIRAYVPRPSSDVPKGLMTVSAPGDVHQPSESDKPGAGYAADTVEVLKLKQGGDTWFRPADICVAPDGAVYVCDWYDPGVGGHATGDTPKNLHGRVYRIAPQGYKTAEVKLDLDSVKGQIAALCSPNLATRYLGYTKLLAGGDEAHKALAELYEKATNPRLRARALWLLARGKEGKQDVEKALKDKDVNIRVTAVRAARAIKMDMIKLAGDLTNDAHPFVRRELALAMNFEPTDKAIPVLVKLADKYDGEDRWYLEAIGIGATGREKELLEAWEKDRTNKDPKVAEGITWRLKKEATPGAPAASGNQKTVTGWWALGALAAPGGIDEKLGPEQGSLTSIDLSASYEGADKKPVKWEQIKTNGDSVDFVKFCEAKGQSSSHVAGYFATTVVAAQDEKGVLLLGSDDGIKVWLNGKLVHRNETQRALQPGDDVVPVQLKKGRNLLICKLYQMDGPSGISASVSGTPPVTFSDDLNAAADAGTAAPAAGAQAAAGPVFQLSAGADPNKVFKTKDGKVLPPISVLMSETGDAVAGEKVFKNTQGANCLKCHQIGNDGNMIGPPLTVIGSKLSKGQLCEAILYPSASVLMHYETWVVKTKKGDVTSGLMVEDVPGDHCTLKDSDGKYHDFDVNDIDRRVMQKISLMPEGLNEAMTEQDLVNLVEFLSQHKAQ